MERKTMKLWDIMVPAKMTQCKPKAYKLMGMRTYYNKHKHFYGEIIVNKNYKLLDGYVVYYTAKEMKVYDVPVKVVTNKDRLKYYLRRVLKRFGIKNYRLH